MISTFLMYPSFSNTIAIVIIAMIAIITFSSYSITCWLMDIAVTVCDTAWNKCYWLGTSLNQKKCSGKFHTILNPPPMAKMSTDGGEKG